MNSVSILGTKICQVTRDQAMSIAKEFLLSPKPHYIFTPNPEMVVDAQRDPSFTEALNQGDLNLCDGFGLSLFTHTPRIPGVDFMLSLCALAEANNKSIYLLGSGNEKTIITTKENLLAQFPKLKIAGIDPGYKINLMTGEAGSWLDFDPRAREEAVHRLIMAAPDILFVAFGHNKQEQWIVSNVPDLPSVRLAMGVGGAFDFISGKITRAPRFLRALGLEWLWRLVLEPKRIKRILKAVVVFPFLVLRDKK